MAFVDLAFDRVPHDVVWWTLRSLGVDELIVLVMKAMYENALKVNGRKSKAAVQSSNPYITAVHMAWFM